MPENVLLTALFPALKPEDLLGSGRCIKDGCSWDAAIPTIAFNGYCKRCAKAAHHAAVDLLLEDHVAAYWAMLGRSLPNLRSMIAEADISGRYGTPDRRSKIERLLRAKRGD